MSLCEQLQKNLKQLNDPNTYNMWLRTLKLEEKDDAINITTTSKFSVTMIKDKFSSQISSILEKITGKQYKLKFKWENVPQENLMEEINDQESQITVKKDESKSENLGFFEINPKNDLKLSPKFTFESFVVGKNNQLASAAANAVVNSLGSSYNPLFIYGKTGLGKTHLMQAIGHAVQEQDKKKKVIYLPCEEFMNLMIEAIQKSSMQKFRLRFRKVDILMIDDIQFLAKKEQTQEEFFNTFNALYNEHKQIVLTSDSPPKDLTNLQERLVSRFEWGLVTDIQPPSYETRISILRKKCELSHLKVNNEVIDFLAEHFKDNVRQMEGALNRVYTYAKFLNKPLSVELASENLKDLIKSDNTKRITVEEILQKVGQYYSVTMLQLQGPKRLKNYAFPRQVAMYISRNLTDLSLPEIGSAFGGRDHTTVIHACKKISEEMGKNNKLRNEIDIISQLIITA
ncbi:MAG: hypothetical protein ACD_79C00166G0002 [uncultured bacterium]|nr:MAG: hypothetical protein ACD_79C00166G0002 [uncultured bacterium]